MMDDHEDVPGAAAANRAMVAREYAFQRIAAALDDSQPEQLFRADPETTRVAIRTTNVKQAERGALYAGLTLAEVDAAELEIRRIYLNESGRDYLLAVARQHLALLQLPDPRDPGGDAEDYRRSDGMSL